MRLARLAYLTLEGSPTVSGFRMQWADVTVETGGVRGRPGHLILTASVPLTRRPTLTEAGLRVPASPRVKAEQAIEAAADTSQYRSAGDERSRHQIHISA